MTGRKLRRRALAVLACALLWATPAGAQPGGPAPTGRDPALAPAGRYQLDPAKARLTARMALLGGLYRYDLGFGRLAGGFAFDPADWRSARVTIEVDPRSVEADHERVRRAVIADFAPERYPVIRFASRSLALDAEGRGKLAGDLTLRGVTRPVTLDVTFKGLSAGGAAARLGFSGVGRIRRTDFGLSVARPFAGEMVDLAFDVEFVRK